MHSLQNGRLQATYTEKCKSNEFHVSYLKRTRQSRKSSASLVGVLGKWDGWRKSVKEYGRGMKDSEEGRRSRKRMERHTEMTETQKQHEKNGGDNRTRKRCIIIRCKWDKATFVCCNGTDTYITLTSIRSWMQRRNVWRRDRILVKHTPHKKQFQHSFNCY